MKAHISVDTQSILVHTVGVTTGKINDAEVFNPLIRENDQAILRDKDYVSEQLNAAAW